MGNFMFLWCSNNLRIPSRWALPQLLCLGLPNWVGILRRHALLTQLPFAPPHGAALVYQH